ncbi:MFS transporter [Streptomyces sp. B1866]|uniref:MFS transporter n=1 Tax=Streptomyces sp. B1866 TaxID=3075431 RepID=UPI00288CEE53|nr:MFS transporter [Streptomyces sp. B1866]MDT3395512.1 MFS transporter [Streptomyces sp. B1866]
MTASQSAAARRGLLFVLSGNMLIDALEVSVAMVALPSIAADLDLSVTGASWLVVGFALGFGGLLLFGGRLVAILGRRPVYLAGLVAFAAASLAAGVAPTAGVLIATRAVKGFCVALTAPTGLAIISSAYPEGPARVRAVSVYSLFGASGFTVGLLLSGLLTQASWRWTFAFPAPVALLLFAYALRLIPREEPRPTGPRRRYDAAGAAALAGGLALVLYAITARAPLALLPGAALLAAFAAVERAAADPLVPPAVLGRPALLRSALGAAVLNGTFWGFLLVSMVRWQTEGRWSPLDSGLALLPASLLLAASAPFSGRLIRRFGAARLIAAGAACATVGYALYLRPGTDPAYLPQVLPTTVLVGLGFVCAFSALHVQAVTGVPAAEQGAVSGVYQTAVQVGGALTVAAVAALDAVSAHRAMLLVTAVSAAGLCVALTGVLPAPARGRVPAAGGVPKPRPASPGRDPAPGAPDHREP